MRAYVVDADGTDLHVLLDDESRVFFPHCWLPTGEIVLTSSTGDPAAVDLWLVRADGTGLRRLTADGAPKRLSNQPCAADGSRIAYSAGGDYPFTAYWIATSDGERVPLTPEGSSDEPPTLSPDGRYAAITRGRPGPVEGEGVSVLRVDLETGTTIPLSTTTPGNAEALWSPDGTRLVLSAVRYEWPPGSRFPRRLRRALPADARRFERANAHEAAGGPAPVRLPRVVVARWRANRLPGGRPDDGAGDPRHERRRRHLPNDDCPDAGLHLRRRWLAAAAGSAGRSTARVRRPARRRRGGSGPAHDRRSVHAASPCGEPGQPAGESGGRERRRGRAPEACLDLRWYWLVLAGADALRAGDAAAERERRGHHEPAFDVLRAADGLELGHVSARGKRKRRDQPRRQRADDRVPGLGVHQAGVPDGLAGRRHAAAPTSSAGTSAPTG